MAKKTKISDAQARENSLRQPSKSFIRTWCAALRKLIWIDDFERGPYTRKAKVLTNKDETT